MQSANDCARVMSISTGMMPTYQPTDSAYCDSWRVCTGMVKRRVFMPVSSRVVVASAARTADCSVNPSRLQCAFTTAAVSFDRSHEDVPV